MAVTINAGTVTVNMIGNAQQYINMLNQMQAQTTASMNRINNTIKDSMLDASMTTIRMINQLMDHMTDLYEQSKKPIEIDAKISSQSFSEAMATWSTKIKEIGEQLTNQITKPLLDIGSASVSTSNEFEVSMSRIVGLVGISREQVKQWGEDIKAMAPSFGKTPEELAKGLYFVTSGGLRGKDALDALVISSKAAAAGLGEVKTVANAVKSAVNAYGKENISVARAADAVTAAVREGKMEASEMVAAIPMVLPLAKSMGVDFYEVAGAMAAMTRTGTTARQAGVALQAFLLSVLKPTEQANEELGRYGLTMHDIRMMIQKPGGVIEAFRFLDKTFKGNDESMGRVFANARALRAVLNPLAQDTKTVDDVMKEVRESTGDVDKAFQAWADTAAAKYQQATQKMTVATIELGDALKVVLAEPLEFLSNTLSSIIKWFKDLSATTKYVIVTLGMIVAVVGPFMVVAGSIGLLISTITAAQFASLALTTTLYALGSVLVMLPSIAAIAGIAALVFAITGANDSITQFNKNLQHNKELQDSLLTSRKGTFERQIEKGEAIKNPQEKLDYYEKLVEQKQKELRGSNNAIADAEKTLEEVNTTFGSALSTIPWFGKGAKMSIEAAEASLANAKSNAKGFSSEIETLTNKLEAAKAALATAEREGTPYVDPKIQQSVDDLTAKFQLQLDTFYKTGREAEVYKLELDGATESQLELVDATAKYLDEMDKQDKLQKKAQELLKKSMTPQEKFTEQIKELDEMMAYGVLSAEDYAKAFAGIKDEMSGANKELQRFDSAASGSAEAMSRLAAWKDKMNVSRPDVDAAKAVAKRLGNKVDIAENAYNEAKYGVPSPGGGTDLMNIASILASPLRPSADLIKNIKDKFTPYDPNAIGVELPKSKAEPWSYPNLPTESTLAQYEKALAEKEEKNREILERIAKSNEAMAKTAAVAGISTIVGP